MCILGLMLGESNGRDVWVPSSELGGVCRVAKNIWLCLDSHIFQDYLGIGVALDNLRISMFRFNNGTIWFFYFFFKVICGWQF